MLQSPDIEKKFSKVISDFWIFDQSFIKENVHNSRTSNDIDIKLGPVTKIVDRDRLRHKNFAMTLCQKIVISY